MSSVAIMLPSEASAAFAFVLGSAALVLRARRRRQPLPPAGVSATLPADLILHVLRLLPLSDRLSCASISSEWLRASQDPFLYAVINRLLVGRRDASHKKLSALVSRCASSATTEVCFAGMRNVNAGIIAALAECAPSLLSLDLSACEVTEEALEDIAKFRNLQKLRLWAAGDVSDEGLLRLFGDVRAATHTSAAAAFDAISAVGEPSSSDTASHHGRIGRLKLSATVTLHAEMRELDLRACADVLHDRTLQLVAHACPNLQTLKLKGVRAPMRDALLTTLSQRCHALVTLDASGGQCTDAGLSALAKGCPRLRELYLAGCSRVGNDGVVAVAERGQLRVLDLQGCATVGDPAALALASHCGATLETISFQCCARLSDRGFDALVARCDKLRHVTLKNSAVTDEAVDRAEMANPTLCVVFAGGSLGRNMPLR